VTVVVVPYVEGMLRPETQAVVEQCGYAHRFVELGTDDDRHYGRLWRRLWSEGETFVICEHDVAPTLAQLDTICSCSHAWCSFNYVGGGFPNGPHFGLARYDARLMVAYPLAGEVGTRLPENPKWQRSCDPRVRLNGERAQKGGDEGIVEWWHMDSRVQRDLIVRGVEHHVHKPPVEHLHYGAPTYTGW
jgi:hypothetical protein